MAARIATLSALTGLALVQAIIEFFDGATAISLGKRAIDSYASGRLKAYKSQL